MLLRRHPRVHRLLMSWLVLLWMGGVGGSLVDQLVHTHVMCAEHGVIEHAAEGSDQLVAAEDGPTASALDASEHGEACPTHWLPHGVVLPEAPALRAPELAALGELSPLVFAAAPRAPPLAYAPKTSPPQAS